MNGRPRPSKQRGRRHVLLCSFPSLPADSPNRGGGSSAAICCGSDLHNPNIWKVSSKLVEGFAVHSGLELTTTAHRLAARGQSRTIEAMTRRAFIWNRPKKASRLRAGRRGRKQAGREAMDRAFDAHGPRLPNRPGPLGGGPRQRHVTPGTSFRPLDVKRPRRALPH